VTTQRTGRFRLAGVSRSSIATCSAIVLLLCAVGFAQTSAGKRITRSIGLSSASEPFTELYFASPSRAAAATEGLLRLASRQNVAFLITNREHRSARYVWTIRSDGTPRSAGTSTVHAGASVAVTRSVLTGCRFKRATTIVRIRASRHRRARMIHRRGPIRRVGPERVLVSVSLASQHESVGYWLECSA
jgi:hypothetical protein